MLHTGMAEMFCSGDVGLKEGYGAIIAMGRRIPDGI